MTPDNGRLISGTPLALRAALADRVRDLRGLDPLAPITVLVGTSLQRPYLARDLAARLGGHANVRILMPGDLALLLGAPALVEAGRRALPPLADRVLLADVVRAEPGYFAPVAETPGLTEALYPAGAGAARSWLWPGQPRRPPRGGHGRAGEGDGAGTDTDTVRTATIPLLRPGRRPADGGSAPSGRPWATRLGHARHASCARAATDPDRAATPRRRVCA